MQQYNLREVPIITVGKYAGKRIDELPVSYCRWMLTQDFPPEWVEWARKKVEASPLSKEQMSCSRHALDRFSQRFLYLWTEYKVKCGNQQYDGIATFLVKLAERAWNEGKDISKHRHKDDGIVKDFLGIKFVFKHHPDDEEYKDLITVMRSDE